MVSEKFQSTLPRGERRPNSSAISVPTLFQSTLPRGERLQCSLPFRLRHLHFNPRSREGSDRASHAVHRLNVISIHAPARGATPAPSLRMPRLSYFNPRSREGSDFASFHAFFKPEISIHAPARGATRISFTSSDASTFQSTLPRGERPSPVRSHSGLRLFQSTLPRGERPMQQILKKLGL